MMQNLQFILTRARRGPSDVPVEILVPASPSGCHDVVICKSMSAAVLPIVDHCVGAHILASGAFTRNAPPSRNFEIQSTFGYLSWSKRRSIET